MSNIVVEYETQACGAPDGGGVGQSATPGDPGEKALHPSSAMHIRICNGGSESSSGSGVLITIAPDA